MAISLIDRDHGRTVESDQGEVLTIRLIENPTTGYRWAIESSGGLELIDDDFEISSKAMGSGGERVFQFRAASPGSHELHLKNWREWEGDKSITKRFDVNLLVK